MNVPVACMRAGLEIENHRLGLLQASSQRGIEAARRIEQRLLALPQVEMLTHHVLHAGVYSRTITIPAGVGITGALIKIPTTVAISGDCDVLIGDGEQLRVQGYYIVAAAAGRKQAFIAHRDTTITMSFATKARTIEAAEAEFTDEAHLLASRHGRNVVTITED